MRKPYVHFPVLLLTTLLTLSGAFAQTLHEAAETGAFEDVKRLLAEGADPNARSWGGRTPLHSAAEAGTVAIVEYLLDHRADVNAALDNGRTALHLAAARYALTPPSGPVIDALVAHGATIEARDAEGMTPLIVAIAWGSVEAAAGLLKHGADPGAEDRSGLAPLYYAIVTETECAFEKVQLLLDHGVDPNAGAGDGPTWLEWAYWRENREQIARLLVERGAQHTVFTAASVGDVALLRTMLEAGQSAAKVGPYAVTALHEAVANGHTDAAKLLLEYGASVDARAGDGTAVIGSVRDAATLEVLVTNGADVNERSGPSMLAPLHLAVGNPELVRALLARGADPNIPDRDGIAPIHYALIHRSAETVALLLTSGARVGLADASGSTPLHCAVRVRDRAGAGLLLGYGADPGVTDEYGWTPVGRAVDQGDTGMLELLLAAGPDAAVLQEARAVLLQKDIMPWDPAGDVAAATGVRTAPEDWAGERDRICAEMLQMIQRHETLVTAKWGGSLPPRVVVDNSLIALKPGPFPHGGAVYVPLRQLAEVLGAECRWDADNRAVHVHRGEHTYVVAASSAIEVDGTLCVPVRVLAESLGFQIEWRPEPRSIRISTT